MMHRKRVVVEGLESRTLLAGFVFGAKSDIFDAGKRIVPTADGGFVLAGLFGGAVDFDPGAGSMPLTSSGDTDIFVAKYSSTGDLEWARRIGGNSRKDSIRKQRRIIDIASNPRRVSPVFPNGVGADPRNAAEFVNDILIGTDGSITLAGSFVGRVDFDPGAGTHEFKTFDSQFHDAFVMKLDENGAFVWADQFGARFTETATALAGDAFGNIFVTGDFTRTVDFVKGDRAFRRSALGRADVYLMQLDSDGAVNWVDTFGGTAIAASVREAGNDLAVDSAGNVIVVGTFSGKTDFDPSRAGKTILQASKSTDGFIAKYANDGGFINAVRLGGRGYDGITSVAIDAGDNVIVSGYFETRTFDANPGAGVLNLSAMPTKAGNSPKFTDLFVEKLNSDLEMVWAKQLSGTGIELGGQVSVDSGDNVVLSGSFHGTATFGAGGPTVTSVQGDDRFRDANDRDRRTSYDMFLWKLSSAGAITWAKTLRGAGDDFAIGSGLMSDDSILLTGRWQETVDFDPNGGEFNVATSGLATLFVAHYDSSGAAL